MQTLQDPLDNYFKITDKLVKKMSEEEIRNEVNNSINRKINEQWIPQIRGISW
ncbi:hypothetical protein [Vibrio quintilis]|uniref:Uncharacterized protein n=1 Tax=Vibrio quintilis TaxID=1117707 RepID=A0A1M7YS16_9VIBR|nr:hypothetical protein [Vibrio quintilis]SHO55421.1 hypothetical protein VQ7734_01149 [Vibrio quintilis]